ncbi:MAG: HipA domain-containing protein [Aerococcus sp.]|nr:HipA domain-containing protein [Aerococcus sp.]
MLDLVHYPKLPNRIYGGRNGTKIGVEINHEAYMVKFPASTRLNGQMSDANNSVSEFLGCHIFSLLGFNSQDTFLATYDDQLVVACKDFEQNGYVFKEFAFLKNSMVGLSQEGYGTELSEVLLTIDEQQLIDAAQLHSFFWQMFVVDAYIGNFDRHNGNWGFLTNYTTNDTKLAPIFDCGSCLFPQTDEQSMKKYLEDQEERDKRIYKYPTSALKLNGVKINYPEYLTTTTNKDCLQAIIAIHDRIDERKINQLIDECEPLSDTNKEFLKVMLHDRKVRIIDHAYDIQVRKAPYLIMNSKKEENDVEL